MSGPEYEPRESHEKGSRRYIWRLVDKILVSINNRSPVELCCGISEEGAVDCSNEPELGFQNDPFRLDIMKYVDSAARAVTKCE